MRNIQKLIVFTLLTFVFSCSNDDITNEINNTNENSTLLQKNANNAGNNNQASNNYSTPIYSQNELIIQYKPNTSQNTKAYLRQLYQVSAFEICKHCPDQTLERWTFYGGNIGIEPRHAVIDEGAEEDEDLPKGEGILNVDYNFNFGIENYHSKVEYPTSPQYQSFIKTNNSGLTIAVIDTGLDASLPVFSGQFLYNAGPDADGGMLSGWNFVNNHHNTYDDNDGKHGSVIIHQITGKLTSLGVDHQIMPIKSFNAIGRSDYFTSLCAMNLALQHADIITTSFGWDEDGGIGDLENSIYSNLIATHNDVIVIASAGNNYQDNDENMHFPSNFPLPNIIATAAANEDTDNIAWFSNYGNEKVDFFAPGYLTFLGYDMYGTSFAAPVVATKIAVIMDDPMTPSSTIDQIIFALVDEGYNCDSFTNSKPVKYDRLIKFPDHSSEETAGEGGSY